MWAAITSTVTSSPVFGRTQAAVAWVEYLQDFRPFFSLVERTQYRQAGPFPTARSANTQATTILYTAQCVEPKTHLRRNKYNLPVGDGRWFVVETAIDRRCKGEWSMTTSWQRSGPIHGRFGTGYWSSQQSCIMTVDVRLFDLFDRWRKFHEQQQRQWHTMKFLSESESPQIPSVGLNVASLRNRVFV